MLSGAAVLGELPYLAEPGGGAGAFEPIGEAFCREWSKIADE